MLIPFIKQQFSSLMFEFCGTGLLGGTREPGILVVTNRPASLMKRPAAVMERPETRVACLGDSNTVGGGLGRLNSNERVRLEFFCFVSP